MIRNCVKLNAIVKIRSSYFILTNRTYNFCRLNVPSVCNYHQNTFICSSQVQNTLLRPTSYNAIKDCVRFKSKGQKSGISAGDSDSDEELGEGEYDEDGNKLREIKLKSVRVDNVLGKCLGFSRRRIDETFFDSKFRLNGEPLPKKSSELRIGDVLEVCTDPVDTGGSTNTLIKLNVIKIKPLEDLSSYLLTYSIEKDK